ncbi:hypothetical protein DMP17_31060 [Pseudonocardia sp. TMWB2A]|uniref:hypothetical protein n=1 Tax=Pseudonocardia sp. TMWB2A TaxID=687430 RepID=UPI00307E06CA
MAVAAGIVVVVVVGYVLWVSPGSPPDRAEVTGHVERVLARQEGGPVTATCTEPVGSDDGTLRATCTLTAGVDRRGWATVTATPRSGATEHRGAGTRTSAGAWWLTVAGAVPVDTAGRVDHTVAVAGTGGSASVAATGTVLHALRALGHDGAPLLGCPDGDVPVGATVTCTATGPGAATVSAAGVTRVDAATFRVRARVPAAGG